MKGLESCRREFPERAYERCGEPARYIFWGKLFPAEQLGPRCENCAYDHLGGSGMSRLDQYAVYVLPAPDRSDLPEPDDGASGKPNSQGERSDLSSSQAREVEGGGE